MIIRILFRKLKYILVNNDNNNHKKSIKVISYQIVFSSLLILHCSYLRLMHYDWWFNRRLSFNQNQNVYESNVRKVVNDLICIVIISEKDLYCNSF